MVCIGMPLRLHVLFGVPVDLALQVTAYQANGSLHDSHRVAVGISRHGFKLPVYKGRAIIKIHACILSPPMDGGRGSVRRTYVCAGALDVLHTTCAFQEIEVVGIGPIGTHANTQVFTAALHISPHIGHIGFEQTAKHRGLAITTWKHHQINIVKKALLYLVPGKQLDLAQGRQSGDNPVDRIDRTRGMVYKNSDGFLHAGRLSRAAFCYRVATSPQFVMRGLPQKMLLEGHG